jgi:hypothetical protein
MKLKLCVLLTGSMLLIFSTMHAQKPAAFIKGGVNFSNITITNDGDVNDNKMLTGFHVGLQGDIPLLPVLSVQPGLFFTTKGSKTEYGKSGDDVYWKATTNPMYVELPVNIVFKAPVGDESKFYVGAGPYVAMGVAGKNKVNGSFFGVNFSSEDNIEWSDDDPTTTNVEENAGYGIMRRFDYGLNGTIGVEGRKAIVSVNYGYGLAKLQSGTNSSEDDKNKHRVLSVTLGFRL